MEANPSKTCIPSLGPWELGGKVKGVENTSIRLFIYIQRDIRRATWSEVDWKACTLTIPASRMKGGLAHVVPLTRPALDILKAQLAKRSNSNPDLIFPSDFITTQPYEGSNINRLMPKPFTVHATARSSFRDWAGDKTEFPREIAEMALAHRVGNATELAYRRSTALERRGALMKAWADYLTAPPVE
ncbi:MAG: hypothetical protein EOS70_13800 [Mesorhizobium sp.]|uniref:tyrosine-type recombinase/integrase n=1 Tax=Mesorhizobium sp. TaxID=1871066 RepID=UPI000FE9D98E|nr:tyrosine-type recombinase/integrase [Mesorhizobium sp.]RWC34653.1 MAG: hypothetical protein EOS70_13800 [Mesorhizobium sp.]TIS73880.1 MAG: hypothetical protein E5W94_26550 [Mesorhizobium sp.]